MVPEQIFAFEGGDGRTVLYHRLTTGNEFVNSKPEVPINSTCPNSTEPRLPDSDAEMGTVLSHR